VSVLADFALSSGPISPDLRQNLGQLED